MQAHFLVGASSTWLYDIAYLIPVSKLYDVVYLIPVLLCNLTGLVHHKSKLFLFEKIQSSSCSVPYTFWW